MGEGDAPCPTSVPNSHKTAGPQLISLEIVCPKPENLSQNVPLFLKRFKFFFGTNVTGLTQSRHCFRR